MGNLAPSSSNTKNDQEICEGEKEKKETGEENPEPNLGEGETSVRGSEPLISPLSLENQRSLGEQNTQKKNPSSGMPSILKMRTNPQISLLGQENRNGL